MNWSLVLARHAYDRGVINPCVEVRAGPFWSTIGQMLNHGWEFESSLDDYSRCLVVRGRNPRSNMVAAAKIHDYQHLRTMTGLCLYVPPEAALTAQIAREIHMPAMEFSPMEVGKAIPSGFGMDVELIIYEANVKPEEERPSELIVMPEDISGLLEKIKKAQEPRAREILANERQAGKLKELSLKAKILTFPKAG